MDERVRFLADDLIYRFEEVFVDLLFAEVHAGLGIEAVECCEAQVGVGDVDELHLRYLLSWFLLGYKGVGVGGETDGSAFGMCSNGHSIFAHNFSEFR